MPTTRLLAAVLLAAALLAPASASADLRFRTLTVDYDVTHIADWQTEDAAGRQSLALATGEPVRQSIVLYSDSDVPFSVMSNDELAFDPPRGTVRRSADGAAPCAAGHPRVRSYFQVEGRGRMGRGPYDLELNIGNVAGLGTACGGGAEPELAAPPAIAFARGARTVRRLKVGRRVTLTARIERGPGGEEACPRRPAAGVPWACSVTEAEVKVRRLD